MRKILAALLAVVLLMGGCTQTISEETKYSKITAEEAKEIIDTEEHKLVDVRTPEEYGEEHIEGALLIPDYEIEKLAESKLPDKDEKILVYCRSGSRSKAATKKLIDMGYTNVHDMGGIMDWTYETVEE